MIGQILQKYFPMIRTEQEVLTEVSQKPALDMLYKSWNSEQQREFLDFCTGVKGCKLLYDPFFKQVMNPDIHPERLEKFLSLLLKKHVKILQVLPNESRMAAEDTLLALEKGLPVIVSEFGLSEADGNGEIDKTSANQWFKLLNKYNISYFCWSLSNKDETSSLLKAGTAKTSSWKSSDLSTAGKYIKKKYLARQEKLGAAA